jgi:hypothetical protein
MLAALFPKSKPQRGATPAFGSRNPIPQARRQCLSRVRATRCGPRDFRISSPAFEPVQPRADGLDRRPAVKTLGGIGRAQEAAVSGRGPPQETPEGRAGLESGQLADEVSEALL